MVDGNWIFRDNDQVAVAIHLPEREEALRALADTGWRADVDWSSGEPDSANAAVGVAP